MKKVEMKQKLKELIATKRFKVILGGIGATLALVCVLQLFLLVFPIKKFEVVGDTQYDINEIVDGSGIRSGQRLYLINKSKVEERLIAACPYIKSVKIKQKFPNKVCFEVEERVAGWYLQIGDDFYALDYDLKVLLETFDEESLKERGLTKLVLPDVHEAIIGEYPEFGNGDEQLQRETLEIIDIIRNHRIKERMTYLNLENRFEIKMTVDETYTVNFGGKEDASTKFSMIEKIIESSSFGGYAGGEINVINPLAHSFRGYKSEGIDREDTNEKADDE